MKMYKILIPLFCLCIFVSCQKEVSLDDNVAAKTMLDVAYGTDSLQKMDIYLPEGRTVNNTNVIVMIHGGAWAAGDKEELDPFVDTFKRRLPGYALFNINYRLSDAPDNIFPTQENDVKAAIEFISSKSAEYAISQKYAFVGASAGAHLALLQGYKYSTPVKPKVLVSFCGPTDLNDMYNNPAGGNPFLPLLLASVVGETPLTNPAIYNSSSPFNYVTAGAPATLLLYGDIDPLVSPDQADLLKAKLQSVNAVNQYTLYIGTAHVDTWTNTEFFDSFTRIESFIKANIN